MTIPHTRRVVVTVFFIHRAENVAEVPTFFVGVQVMRIDEFLNTFTPDKIVGIIKVNLLDSNLISSNRVGIIRDALCNPMMASHDFHIPDIIFVGKQHRVASRRAVLLDELTQILNPMTSRFDEWQHHVDDQVFIKPIFNQRIKPQRPFIAVSAFGG